MNDPLKLSASRQLIRWLVLIAFVMVALFCLINSIYSVWASGGSSNPYYLGWSRQAIGYLCFALGALFFGLGLFKGIQTFPGATKKTAVFLVLGALLTISPYIGRFMLIDKCLDRGESWNRETIQCSDE